jgi:RHS repeat-associated protein
MPKVRVPASSSRYERDSSIVGQPSVSYVWDNANRLTGISQGTTSIPFHYDNANRRTTLTLPNGILVAYAYDNDSHITGMAWTLAGNSVGDLEYNYDADGRVIEKTGSFAQTNLPQPVSGDTFNAANEMTAFNGVALTYDANGNLTNDGTNTYAWDARNHLLSLVGANAASFTYDTLGRRAMKAMNGVSTQFLYDGSNPIQELQNGAPSANMLNGLEIDEYFQRTDTAGARSFLTDILGSTLALADSNGAIQTQYTYDPFGNATLTGQPNTNPFQFTNRENDGTGLYFYRARYYSPTFQRFISQDPIEFLGGDPNLYRYVGDNPANDRDPSGELLIGAAIGALVGGGEAYASAKLQGLCETDALKAAAIGAAFGALIGAIDPTEGIGTLTAVGALAGGYGDLVGQLAGNGGDFSNLGPIEIGGATVGGGLAGALGSLGPIGATGELGQAVLGSWAGLGPGIVGGPSGAALDNMAFPNTSGGSCGCSH